MTLTAREGPQNTASTTNNDSDTFLIPPCVVQANQVDTTHLPQVARSNNHNPHYTHPHPHSPISPTQPSPSSAAHVPVRSSDLESQQPHHLTLQVPRHTLAQEHTARAKKSDFESAG
jgi:hypothetical protein